MKGSIATLKNVMSQLGHPTAKGRVISEMSAPTFIKADIERLELEMLNGAVAVLR